MRIARWTFMALAILAAPLSAVEPTALPHPSPFPGENFGKSVAKCDGLSFVGRPYDAASGSVAVYRGTDLIDEVFYPGAQGGARFGEALAVSPDCARLIVGAPYDDTLGANAGRCYVFNGSDGDYTFDAALEDAHAVAGDESGQSVAVSKSGTSAACGAFPHGKVNVYWDTAGGWEGKKLTFLNIANPADSYAGFGLAFIGNQWLVATAPLDYSGNISWMGSFFLFKQNLGGTNQWGQSFKGVINGAYKLGFAVSASGRRVLLGAPGESGLQPDDSRGAAYSVVIHQDGNGWTLEQALAAPVPQAGAQFGWSVALNAHQALVGEAWRDIPGTNNAGRWMLFLQEATNPWSFAQEIIPADVDTDYRNGWSSAAYGGNFAGGAPYSDIDGVDAGAGYIHGIGRIFADGFELGDTGIWSATAP